MSDDAAEPRSTVREAAPRPAGTGSAPAGPGSAPAGIGSPPAGQGTGPALPAGPRRDARPARLLGPEPPPAAPPTAPCLACRSRRNHRLARWERMPLSALGLPGDAEAARRMARFELDLRQCSACGHVFHARFDYERVPYEEGSNLMFNAGASWRRYTESLAAEWVEAFALTGARVVEVGCAEGLFLERLVRRGALGIGFEPGPDSGRARERGLDVRPEYFDGAALAATRPDAIVCRHVLEHLPDPLELLEDLAHAADTAGIAPVFLAEVPLIEKALDQRRLNDFLYEHVSNFTRRSFRTLFERAGWEVLDVRARFADEVVTLAARPAGRSLEREVAARAEDFRAGVEAQTEAVHSELVAWRRAGLRTALWGATGKGAAFINQFGIGPELVGTVIDSDLRKVGRHVPGTGQPILGPDALATAPVDRILICTNWRARDIEREVRSRLGVEVELWVCFGGRLVPLTDDLPL